MNIINKFIKLLIYRSILFLYLFVLITAGALALYIFPISEILSGLLVLADTNMLSSIVSFAQWLIADGIIQYTFILVLAAPAPIALVFSLLFAGAFGSFAKGAKSVCGFPAKDRMGVMGGYRNRFFHVIVLFFIALVLLLLFALIWIISAIPLAVISELVSRGAMQSSIYYALLAVTVLAIYTGLLFLRVYSMALIPALYSSSRKPIVSAFSFASHNFFRITKYFIIADIILVLQSVLYGIIDNSVYVLLINCFISALLIFFLFHVLFVLYSAKGYGYDEYMEIEDNGEYDGAYDSGGLYDYAVNDNYVVDVDYVEYNENDKRRRKKERNSI